MFKNQNFIDKQSQRMSIGRLVVKRTNIEMKCQICGNKAQIMHNYEDPYSIKIICINCKKHKQKVEDLPFIKIEDHIIKNCSLYINEKKIIKEVNNFLACDLTIPDYCKKNKITASILKGYLSKYNNIVNSNIDFDTIIKKRIKSKLTKKASVKLVEIEKNNINKIKREQNLSNRDMITLSNNTLNSCLISLTASGKSSPTYQVKFKFAKTFRCKIGDVFPEDEVFNHLKDYREYALFQKSFIQNVHSYLKKQKQKDIGMEKAIKIVSKKTGISFERLNYVIYNKSSFLNKEIESLQNIMKKEKYLKNG